MKYFFYLVLGVCSIAPVSLLAMNPVQAEPSLDCLALNQALLKACREGELADAQRLVKQGADIFYCDESGQTSLYFACSLNHAELVCFLLDKGAGVNTDFYPQMATPLIQACRHENQPLVHELRKRGADIHLKSKGKLCLSPLAALCMKSDSSPQGIALVHEFIAAKCDVNQKVFAESTPLHLACTVGNEPIAAILLQHGADANAVDDCNISPLASALSNDHVGIARVLLEYGADPQVKAMGQTLLHVALLMSSLETLEFTLSLPLDINAKTPDGLTALDLARAMGKKERVQLLLQHGAKE